MSLKFETIEARLACRESANSMQAFLPGASDS